LFTRGRPPFDDLEGIQQGQDPLAVLEVRLGRV
jgi:hypothetical protein